MSGAVIDSCFTADPLGNIYGVQCEAVSHVGVPGLPKSSVLKIGS